VKGARRCAMTASPLNLVRMYPIDHEGDVP
jgi:hypothetical protein